MRAFGTALRTALLFTALTLPTLAQPQPLQIVWEQTAGAYSVDFAPAGALVVSGGVTGDSGRLDLWDAADGAPVAQVGGFPLGRTIDVVFAPDGSRVASAHGSIECAPKGGCYSVRPGLFTWAVPTLTRVAALDTGDDIPIALAYAPDGTTLAVSNSGDVRYHDPVSLAVTQTLPDDQQYTSDLRFSPDGALLAALGSEVVARLRDAQSGALGRTLHHDPGPYDIEFPGSIAFSPDGQLVATGGINSFTITVRIWRVADGALLQSIDVRPVPVDGYGGILSRALVAFSPNGQYVVAGVMQNPYSGVIETRLRFYEVATGALAADYTAGTYTENTNGLADLAMSPGQDHLFAFALDGRVVVAETPLSLSEPVATADEPVAELPGGYTLSAVYPNPFNPSARFTLAVARAQAVRVAVFDALGREVARLHDGVLAAGTAHVFALDGSRLPSGVYVVRATGETFAATRRVTLLR